jgi:RHS repeat-associated protein
MTADGTWTCTYDAENRLTQMARKNGTQTLQFAYDYLGRRVRKTVRAGGPTAAITASTKFVWSGWKLIAELNAGTAQTGASLAKTYLWGPDISGGAGAGGLLAVSQGGLTYYPVYDLHGNVTGYLNASGSVAARYEYNATGQVIASSGNASSFAFGHSTQFTDPESGWVYFGLRFYNPKHGRFINRDPIHEQGGLNLYAYCANTGLNAWDVLGLKIQRIAIPYETSRGGNGYETDAEGNVRLTPMIIEVGVLYLYIDDGLDDSSGSNGSNSSGRDSGDQQRRSAAPSQPSAPNNPADPEKPLKDCYSAARAAHGASSAQLRYIANERIEGFFGSLAAQQSAARWGIAESVATVVRDGAATFVGSNLVGGAASAQWMRAASAGRSLYGAARSYQQVNALAAQVASFKATGNIIRNVSGTVFAVGYNVAAADSTNGAALGSAAEVSDFLLGNQYGQTGILFGLSQATIEYISAAGLSNAQAEGTINAILSSVGRTQQALDNRLQFALSECDKKFK